MSQLKTNPIYPDNIPISKIDLKESLFQKEQSRIIKNRTYQKKYQQDKRPLLCAIRTTALERNALLIAKQQSGQSWLNILYRGLGIKRPTSRKAPIPALKTPPN